MESAETRVATDLRALVFRYRGLLWGVFAAAVLVLPVSFDLVRTCIAIPLLVIGQALRFWAAGIIPKYRTLMLDAPKLVTTGPYSIVRNPLYLGNGLMGCGWALLAGWPWLPSFAAAFFLMYSLVIIPYEERFLLAKFGAEYESYRASVPQLLPSPMRYRSSTDASFDAARSWMMERHSLRMNVVVTVVVAARLFWLRW